MEQADKAVPGGDLFHHLHGELVVVARRVGGGKDRGELVLCRGHLVVLGFGEDAEFPQLFVQIFHVGRHPGLDGPKIVVFQLLAFGRLGAEQGAPAENEVLSLVVQLFVHQKVLLFRTDGCHHLFYFLVSEQPENPQRLFVDRLLRAEEGRLFVERLAAIGAEDRRDAEGAVLDKGVGSGVPSCIAPRFKGGAQPARWETRRIRLPFDEFFA